MEGGIVGQLPGLAGTVRDQPVQWTAGGGTGVVGSVRLLVGRGGSLGPGQWGSQLLMGGQTVRGTRTL